MAKSGSVTIHFQGNRMILMPWLGFAKVRTDWEWRKLRDRFGAGGLSMGRRGSWTVSCFGPAWQDGGDSGTAS